ncbi:MAG: hypothetical protein P4L69_11220 [Desulfosporosinus sp.]|nr:hypothetical protein [Desulfosporosinus sp.]
MDSTVVQRTIPEIIERHALHDDIREVFVEGSEDRRFYQHFLNTRGLSEVSVYSIDTVEIAPDKVNKLGLTDGNRGRVITLAALLDDRISEYAVVCIADKDLDYILDSATDYKLLLFTDCTALDTYAFDLSTLTKYVNIGIQKFPKNPAKIITELSILLRESFLIRAAAAKLGIIGRFPDSRDEGRAKYSQFCEFDRKTQLPSFNKSSYITSCFKNTTSAADIERLHIQIEELRMLLPPVPDQACHGHEFREAFGWYIRQHDGFRTLNPATLTRTLLVAIDMEQLEARPLFKELLRRMGHKTSDAT